MRYMPTLRLPVFGSRVITQGNVINRPASLGQHCRIGKIEKENLSRWMTSLHAPGRHRLREELAHLRQHGKHFHFVEEALRRLHIHERANAIRNLVQSVDFQRQTHAPLRTKLVDQ